MQTSESIHPERHASGTAGGRERCVTKAFSYRNEGDSHLFATDCGLLGIRFVTESLIRIRLNHGDVADWATTPAVIDPAAPVTVDTHAEESVVTLSSAALRVIVWKFPFAIQVVSTDGKLIWKTEEMVLDKSGAVRLTAQSDESEHFYGLGEKTSFLDKRGEHYDMWNSDVYAPHVPEIEALYESIPFLIHMRDTLTYGVFLDNPGRTGFDMRSRQDAYTLETHTGTLDVYVIYGPTMKQVIRSYTGLTGRMPLPPKWALGYHQSRYSYMSQEEVLNLATTFREEQIPCDAIHLDIHYMDGYRVFTWDSERFPQPKAMLETLSDMGFHVVPIVDPGVKRDPRYPIYAEGVAGDWFCKRIEGGIYTGPVWPGEAAFPDFTDSAAAKWWGDKHRFYIDQGIHGIWNDMNEPAIFNEIKTMEPDVMHRNNGNPKTHEELHNLYGMLMSKATYEGLKDGLDGLRPFVLTRAGYSGVQRYAAVWTGDNRSFWEHMAMAMPMVLNLGLSGVTFSGPDVGGFAHHTNGELLARWTQMGAFFPFFRNHSALDAVRQEPWSFGDMVEEICRRYISMRYRLMPHWYSLFHEATSSGLPVIRPLVLEYPDDATVTNLSDEYLVGDSLLVAPVYRPDERVRAVYLPEGVWYNYWTGERHEIGGTTGGPVAGHSEGRQGRHILADAPIEQLPLFVKAGAIIVEQPDAQHHVNGLPDGNATASLRFHVYAGARGQGGASGSAGTNGSTDAAEVGRFDFYEDDGNTFAYEQGAFNLCHVTVREGAGALTVAFHHEHRGYESGRESIEIVIHHLPFEPQQVGDWDRVEAAAALGDASAGWTFDADSRTLTVKVPEDTDEVAVR